jgi:REP element-mobilizing transposase RayT
MLTWTTYGTWLQGDKRQYVKNGKTLDPDPKLQKANQKQLKNHEVKLSQPQRKLINEAILAESEKLGQKVFALAVCSTHVHILLEPITEMISNIVGRYKRAGTIAMLRMGFEGKVWTRGYDKRYCFDEDILKKRIRYIEKHNKLAAGTVRGSVSPRHGRG